MIFFEKKEGFSMIEISIVLSVIGFMIGMSFFFTSKVNNWIKIKKTKANMQLASEAIDAFFAKNKRLPCPALYSNHDSSRFFETTSTTSATTTCNTSAGGTVFGSSSQFVEGTIPVDTLDLSKEVLLDGYQNYIKYVIVRGLGVKNLRLYRDNSANNRVIADTYSMPYDTDTVTVRETSNVTTDDLTSLLNIAKIKQALSTTTAPSVISISNDVAYVLISTGKNQIRGVNKASSIVTDINSAMLADNSFRAGDLYNTLTSKVLSSYYNQTTNLPGIRNTFVVTEQFSDSEQNDSSKYNDDFIIYSTLSSLADEIVQTGDSDAIDCGAYALSSEVPLEIASGTITAQYIFKRSPSSKATIIYPIYKYTDTANTYNNITFDPTPTANYNYSSTCSNVSCPCFSVYKVNSSVGMYMSKPPSARCVNGYWVDFSPLLCAQNSYSSLVY